ncbi:MAG TPA: penicillin-binding protein 1C [Firmicutes bacterium]|jgi:penicillin-binding protein 1C|nr:penicillin-binding protein 1C [Bacillota bacterium]
MTRKQRENRRISSYLSLFLSHLSLFLARARRAPGWPARVAHPCARDGNAESLLEKISTRTWVRMGEMKRRLAGVTPSHAWACAHTACARAWAKMGKKGKRLTAAVLLFFFLFCLAQLILALTPFPEEALLRPTATLVFDRQGRLLRTFTSEDEKWRFQTPLARISPELRKFLVFYEDRWFFWHPGVNPFSFLRAAYQNLRAKAIVAGGSTISMQIARMMEPKPRTWTAKFREVFRACQLEQRYSKKELLEIYFNMAPYGGNIEGVAAASWLYFGKEPSDLSIAEAALLTILPKSPNRYRPDLHPGEARLARDRALARFYRHGLLTADEYHRALLEEVPGERSPLPFIAPHFAQEMRNRHPAEARIYTSIDRDLQLFCEELLAAHIAGLRPEGITNGAVVVLDNRTHELLAAVGSVNFFDERTGGQVNGYLAPRSPGSALKPFLYVLALEKGLITPAQYLEDVPVDYSGFSPINFDRTYNGIVTAREALRRSLNVPAVNLLAQLGENGLHQLLRRAGLSTIIHPAEHYGLSLVLGGCEVTLLELAALYSALANSGEYVYPVFQPGQAPPPHARTKLFDEGAAYIITGILQELDRPDLPSCWEFSTLPAVAWKTGTSYGYRDAWSIGYDPRFTVGVWVGNFSGEGRPGLIGAEAAAPLLFDLFSRMDGRAPVAWFQRPNNVRERAVCALSGQPPGPHCGTLITDLYLTNSSPIATCSLHRSTLLDAATGYRLPPDRVAGRSVMEKTYINWPPRVAAWFRQNGYLFEELPPLLPETHKTLPGAGPEIRSPAADSHYYLRPGIPAEFQKIALEAAAGSEVQKLYWFVNGVLQGTAVPGETLFYLPNPGKHQVVCEDDHGRSSRVELVVSQF